MPNTPLHLICSAQLPLAEAGQLLLIGLVAFVVITLIASISRFHRIIELNESELKTPEECDDYFYVQVTRFVSKISRAASGFTLLILQFRTGENDLPAIQGKVLSRVGSIVRSAEDVVSMYHSDCIGLIIATDEEHADRAASRIATEIEPLLAGLSEVSGWRIGISSFPLHGSGTRDLLDAAEKALDTAGWDPEHRVQIAPEPVEEEDRAKEQEHPDLARKEEKSKSSTLDPLTGVLTPRATPSYMRKYLAELRQKKNPAALLCIGVNRVDHLVSLHGEEAADEMLAAVSRTMQRLTRDADLIGRIDRDNFLLLCPCRLQHAEAIAKRLREAVQKETVLFSGRRIKTSISIGIAAFPDHGRLVRELVPRAMQALNTVREWNTSACLVYSSEKAAQRESV